MNSNFNSNFNSMGNNNNNNDNQNSYPYNNVNQNNMNGYQNTNYSQNRPLSNQSIYYQPPKKNNGKLILLILILLGAGFLYYKFSGNKGNNKIIEKVSNSIEIKHNVPEELVGLWYSDNVRESSEGTTHYKKINNISIRIEQDGTFIIGGDWQLEIRSSIAGFKLNNSGKCYVNGNKNKFIVEYTGKEEYSDQWLYDEWTSYTLDGDKLTINDDIYNRVKAGK